MSIQDQITNDIKAAMKAKDSDKLSALRLVKSAIILEATKDGRRSVSDEISLKIISKLVKQRKDSASIYVEQNRHDLADDELNQVMHIESYLPKQMNENEVLTVVQKVIHEEGASSMSDMGKCMPRLMSMLNGKADGKLISRIVKDELSK